MVAFDAGILIKLFSKKASEERQKLDYLIATLEKTRDRVLIPTPALSEYLVKAGESVETVLEELKKSSIFRIAPFDARAAIECSLAIRRDLEARDKRRGSAAPWQKVKFDQQIVAIAKAHGATKLYTEDAEVKVLASRSGILSLGVKDLPLPPDAAQGKLNLEG